MDGARALSLPEGHPLCDQCGAPSGRLPPVRIHLFHAAALSRCDHCGVRWLGDPGSAVGVRTCSRCGLVHAVPAASAEAATPGAAETACVDCRASGDRRDLSQAEVAKAAELELRHALSATQTWVELPSRSDYLSRLARALAAEIPGAPPDAGVAVFQERSPQTLALPSGTLLLSTGCLETLVDEAELVFVLAHELAHVAAGDTARALCGVALRSVAASTGPDVGEAAWTCAARDLIALGHGADCERAADRVALDGLVRLGYDPASSSAYLARLQARVDAADDAVAVVACAHPPAWDRRVRLDEHRRRRYRGTDGGRTNRELFRRAAGPAVLSAGLVPLPGGLTGPDDGVGPTSAWSRGSAIRTALAIALLAGLILALGFALTR